MAGAHIKLDVQQLGELNTELARLLQLDLNDLLERLAFAGEVQTRQRLSQQKESPAGEPWPAWSADYAAKRHSGHALLENEGDLIDSLESGTEGDTAFWGSDVIYAATHPYGDKSRNIPKRAYLGISPTNKREMAELINTFLSGARPA